jgi:hypothetical protein
MHECKVSIRDTLGEGAVDPVALLHLHGPAQGIVARYQPHRPAGGVDDRIGVMIAGTDRR